MIALPDAENRTIVSSFVWTKHRQTDRRTDRQLVAITGVYIASNADELYKNVVQQNRIKALHHHRQTLLLLLLFLGPLAQSRRRKY